MSAPGSFTEDQLDNGLRLLICEDHVAPIAATVLTYGVGGRHQRDGQFELAHLFEHLMFEGTTHIRRHEHFTLVAEAGGYLNAMTDMEYTSYFHAVPAEALELPLWLEAERLANLAVSQEGLDNQREVVWNEHRQRRENTPYGSATDDLLERLFPIGHPYRMSMAAHAELANATLPGVREFFHTHYAPNNAVLAVLGDVDPMQVRERVEHYLGPIAARPVPPAQRCPEPPVSGEVCESFDVAVPLPRLYFAWRAPADGAAGFDSATLLAAVLGDGRGSRLHHRLVDELELAGEVAGNLVGFAGAPSLMYAYATARAGVDVLELEAAFRDVVGELADTSPSEHELERAVAQRERETLSLLDKLLTRGLLLSAAAAVHGDAGRVSARLAALRDVSAEDVGKAAATIFEPAGQVVLRYLPKHS